MLKKCVEVGLVGNFLVKISFSPIKSINFAFEIKLRTIIYEVHSEEFIHTKKMKKFGPTCLPDANEVSYFCFM